MPEWVEVQYRYSFGVHQELARLAISMHEGGLFPPASEGRQRVGERVGDLLHMFSKLSRHDLGGSGLIPQARHCRRDRPDPLGRDPGPMQRRDRVGDGS